MTNDEKAEFEAWLKLNQQERLNALVALYATLSEAGQIEILAACETMKRSNESENVVKSKMSLSRKCR